MILVSLFLQVYLFLFADTRMRSNKTLGRIFLWLAYLSADSVATFVLGHLVVRVIEPSNQQGLMSFWAPFVLVHLGGQETMTAFSMEDNELWKRHLLNLVIQSVVTGYVVGKASWPDRRLKAALVLVFVSGFCKYAVRTLYLYFARPEFLKSPLTWKGCGEADYEYKRASAVHVEDMRKTLDRMSGRRVRVRLGFHFQETFRLTTDIMAGDAPFNTGRSITLAKTGKLPDMLSKFLSLADHYNAYEHVGTLLVRCYSRLYTKHFVREYVADCLEVMMTKDGSFSSSVGSGSVSKPRQCSLITVFRIIVYIPCAVGLFILYGTIPTALVFFAAAEKRGPLLNSRRGRVDIMVSYTLLVGAVVLDACSVVWSILSRAVGSRFNSKCCSKKKLWCQKLNQYNMINSANVSKVSYKILRYIWEKCGRDVHDVALSMPMKEFILDTLLVSGTRKEWNIASTRGQLALHHRKATTSTLRALEESVITSVDFPISVLIWHIATDICFRHSSDKNATTTTTYSADGLLKKHCYKEMSRELSNYIMYLVFQCGVMLTTYSNVVHDETLHGIADKLSPDRQQAAGVNQDDPKDVVIAKLLLLEEIKIEREELKEQVQTRKVEHEGESKEEGRDEIVQIWHEESANNDNNDAAAKDHMKKLGESAEALYASPVLPRAREVAHELISIKDEAERWDLIAAVWAEMLFYTAPRCGAGFHAEHLAKGGEFVTHVLVLMYLLGPFMPPPGA
jgi:hypothetical protein